MRKAEFMAEVRRLLGPDILVLGSWLAVTVPGSDYKFEVGSDTSDTWTRTNFQKLLRIATPEKVQAMKDGQEVMG